jgi:hypothetical protein
MSSKSVGCDSIAKEFYAAKAAGKSLQGTEIAKKYMNCIRNKKKTSSKKSKSMKKSSNKRKSSSKNSRSKTMKRPKH